MGNPREDAIRRNATRNVPVSRPSPSGAPTAPPGERGGQGTVGPNEQQWISTPQSAEQYYAPGGQGQTNLNISNPAYPNYVGPPVTGDGNTGSGSSGGSPGGSSGAAGRLSGLSLDQIRLFNDITGADISVLGTSGGVQDYWDLSKDSLTGTDNFIKKNLDTLEGEEVDTTPLSITDQINKNYLGQNLGLFGELSLNKEGLGGTTEGGTNWGVSGSLTGGQPSINLGISGNTNVLNRIFGGNAQGGPVGIMSLPQGYANGGEVIEGTDTMEELTPFGGTRERVIDQVEAFDNAPHHIEEPMIGMYGEKIPLTTARRVQKYMDGLDPVKRGLIEEMMQMFSMKKMQEKMQDQQQKGEYFGPRPEEYAI